MYSPTEIAGIALGVAGIVALIAWAVNENSRRRARREGYEMAQEDIEPGLRETDDPDEHITRMLHRPVTPVNWDRDDWDDAVTQQHAIPLPSPVPDIRDAIDGLTTEQWEELTARKLSIPDFLAEARRITLQNQTDALVSGTRVPARPWAQASQQPAEMEEKETE